MTEARWAAPLLAVLLLLLVSAAVSGARAAELAIAYVGREDDPAYAAHRSYPGLRLHHAAPPVDGARVAVRESAVLGRAADMKITLSEHPLAAQDDAAEAITALEDEGAAIVLLDLPADEVARLGEDLADRDLILFNIRHDDDDLRRRCSPVLFHTIPSRAMLSDALAQYLYARNWTGILLLVGETPEDAVRAASFRRAAEKFGLDVVETVPFLLSNDPRRRDQTNIPLMTATDHDVLVLVDAVGEFGRYVPYRTYHPRPVAGSQGLRAAAWHWTWERHGAPQLSQRFERFAERPMEGADWAAWAAVRAVVEAAVRTGSTDPSVLRDYMVSPEMTLDLYKGTPGNFRRWDHQLRQPVLLHGEGAVAGVAPLEGFLHEHSLLDTLGEEMAEQPCE